MGPIESHHHLLGNALKFTASPGVISLIVDPAASSAGNVRFTVEDSGSGIPPEKLEKIFERYERRSRSGDALGLGLAIVSQILKLHDSEISGESEVGRGSRFSFSSPPQRTGLTKGRE